MTVLRLKYPLTVVLMQKFNVDGAFKHMNLHFISAFKTIITYGLLAFISLRLTFRGKSSCCNFSVLVEPMADIMNEALYTNWLQALHSPSPYLEFYKKQIILPSDIPFAPSTPLLFEINTKKDRFVDLYIDDYVNICLDKIRNSQHEATSYFNVITNTFDLFFNKVTENLLNNVF